MSDNELKKKIHENPDRSNTDGSLTVADSNSYLSPYGIHYEKKPIQIY